MLRAAVVIATAITVILGLSAVTAEAQTRVSIGKIIGGNGFHIPSYVAMDQGYFKAERLDARFVSLTGKALVTGALAGNVDFVPIPSGGAQAALSGAEIRYVVGQSLKSHTLPHAPQLNGSVWTLTQTLSQAVCRGGRQVEQVPALQIWFGPQALPQAPQFNGSFWRSAQAVPHRVSPGQIAWQLPAPQNSSKSQTLPHVPQCCGSIWRSTHESSQIVSPGGQFGAQVPAAQT